MKYNLTNMMKANNQTHDENTLVLDTLQHLFLISTPQPELDRIVLERKSLSEEEYYEYTIDIDLKINGIEVDPGIFFRRYVQSYRERVHQKALEILKDDTFNELYDLVDEVEGKIKELVENTIDVKLTKLKEYQETKLKEYQEKL